MAMEWVFGNRTNAGKAQSAENPLLQGMRSLLDEHEKMKRILVKVQKENQELSERVAALEAGRQRAGPSRVDQNAARFHNRPRSTATQNYGYSRTAYSSGGSMMKPKRTVQYFLDLGMCDPVFYPAANTIASHFRSDSMDFEMCTDPRTADFSIIVVNVEDRVEETVRKFKINHPDAEEQTSVKYVLAFHPKPIQQRPGERSELEMALPRGVKSCHINVVPPSYEYRDTPQNSRMIKALLNVIEEAFAR